MHGADALAAAPCTWGAEGSNGDRHLCRKRGMDVIKKNNYLRSAIKYGENRYFCKAKVLKKR